MNKKQIIGSHFANYREAWEANRLVVKRAIHPLLSETYPLEETGEGRLASPSQSADWQDGRLVSRARRRLRRQR